MNRTTTSHPHISLPRPHGGARNRIRRHARISIAIDINIHLGIAHLIHAGDLSQVTTARRLAAPIRDRNLRALRVPLGRVGSVQGQQLVAEEVVAVGQGGGDGAGPAGVLRNQHALAPGAAGERAVD